MLGSDTTKLASRTWEESSKLDVAEPESAGQADAEDTAACLRQCLPTSFSTPKRLGFIHHGIHSYSTYFDTLLALGMLEFQ